MSKAMEWWLRVPVTSPRCEATPPRRVCAPAGSTFIKARASRAMRRSSISSNLGEAATAPSLSMSAFDFGACVGLSDIADDRFPVEAYSNDTVPESQCRDFAYRLVRLCAARRERDSQIRDAGDDRQCAVTRSVPAVAAHDGT